MAFGLAGVALISRFGSADPLVVVGSVVIFCSAVWSWLLVGRGAFGPPMTKLSFDSASVVFEFGPGKAAKIAWDSPHLNLTLLERIEPLGAGGTAWGHQFVITPPSGGASAEIPRAGFEAVLGGARSLGLTVLTSDLEAPVGCGRERKYVIRPRAS